MIKKINWLFLFFITTILSNFIYVSRLFYLIYIIIFFSGLFFVFTKSINYKIVYDKKILLMISIFMIESLTITLINIYNIGIDRQFLRFLLIYSLFLVIIIFIKRYGIDYIKKFYKPLLYFLDIINIINIYEIISKKSIFYTFINNDNVKLWQVNVFETDLFRTFSIFVHPIVYGNFLVCLFWINIFVARKNKIISFISGILVLINLYFTQSRSSWIALIVTLIIYLLNKYINKLKYFKTKIKIKNIIKLICTILCITIIIIIFNNNILFILNKIYLKMITSTSDSYGDISRLQRLGTVNLIYSYMISNGVINFLFGNGLGSVAKFMINHPIVLSGFTTTDNEFMNLFYEFGFIGLISYLLIMLLAIIKLFKKGNWNSIYNLNVYIFISISINMFFYTGFDWLDVFFMVIFSLSIIGISSIENIKRNV